MVNLVEIDQLGLPLSDSLVMNQTLIGSSSNSPASIYLSKDVADQFQSVFFLESGESAEKEEDSERTWNLEGVKSPESLNSESPADQIVPCMMGPGFANLGNTCFLNAVLQCITHTVPLVQGLQSVGHAKPCESFNQGFCLICTLLNHIDEAIAADIRVVSPWDLVRHLSYFSSDFDRYLEQDAHEFLQCFMDRLESCVSSRSGPSDEVNIVKQVFGGCLVSRIQCCECFYCSDTYEPMIDLSIEIGNACSLLDALESFTDIEQIDAEDTKFTCESCKEVVSIEKQLELETAPSIASFHLKRFKNDGSLVDKIDKHVEFPLELDLSPFSRNSDVELKYYLYAIVVHEGISFRSGHYYSCVRISQDEWYRMDDSRVTKVKEEDVLSEEAYILFYAKMGTPWFSSLMMSEKQSKVTNTSPTSVLESSDQASSSSSGIPTNNKMTEDTRCDNIDEVPEANKMTEDTRCDTIDEVPEANKMTEDTRFDNIAVPEAKADDISKGDVTFSFGGGMGRTTPNKIQQISPNSLKFNCYELEATLKENDKFSTPVRSSSPNIYAEEQSPARKTESSKRKLDQNPEDNSSEMKQARRLVRSMPGLRGKRLLEVLNNSSKKKSPQGRMSSTLFFR